MKAHPCTSKTYFTWTHFCPWQLLVPVITAHLKNDEKKKSFSPAKRAGAKKPLPDTPSNRFHPCWCLVSWRPSCPCHQSAFLVSALWLTAATDAAVPEVEAGQAAIWAMQHYKSVLRTVTPLATLGTHTHHWQRSKANHLDTCTIQVPKHRHVAPTYRIYKSSNSL